MLHSLSLNYNVNEDRLILVITFKQAEALQAQPLWLTRRCTLALRQQLEALKGLAPIVARATDPLSRAATAEIHHEVQAQQARIKTEPQAPPPVDPQSARLVVATHCSFDAQTSKGSVRFELFKALPITLNLSEPSLHGFIRVLEKNLERTQWRLPVPAEDPGAAARAVGAIH
jgi:hypothetical protein